MIKGTKKDVPKVIGISKEWEKILEEARKYKGKDNYRKLTKTDKHLNKFTLPGKINKELTKMKLNSRQNNK